MKRKVEELKGEIAREVSRKEMAEKAVEDIDQQNKSCFIQVNNLSQDLLEISEKVRDISLRGASLRGELDDQMAALSAAQESLSKADAKFSFLRDDLAGARQLREGAKAKLGDLVRERDRLLDTVRRSGLEKEELSIQIKEALDAQAGANHEAEQLKGELAALNGKAMEMEKDRDDLDAGRLRLRRDISEAERNLQRLQSEFALVDGRLRAAEDKSGYSRAVEAVRSAIKRDLLQGLHGTIAELGKVGWALFGGS